KAPNPGPNFMIPFGKAKVVRDGTALTVVTYGAVVQRSLVAAKELEEKEGVSVEVIDLRSLSPVDWETIEASVRKTNKVIVAYDVLFFLSGATGLIYELLWVRVLYQSFGSTIQSVTTVVAAYMGGLGLGAWLFGRRADRTPRPAVLYGWLEIAIGVFGILSPL